jgi:hypothetical protein
LEIEYMPSLPEIVVQMPWPSVLVAVTIAPTTGVFAELRTTPAMAPNTGCTGAWAVVGEAGVAAATESSARAGCGPLIPVKAVSIQSAGTVRAILDEKYLFIFFSNLVIRVNCKQLLSGLALAAGRNKF